MSTSLLLCQAKSSHHALALRWLHSLGTLHRSQCERTQHREVSSSNTARIKHGLNLYKIYAETGEEKYLDLCELFLRKSLEEPTAQQVAHA